ncbi:MAG: CoA transferase [Gemmatimonadetes bacterium]|nr:CoA transferase [Gemmatimonadota bacterium]
MTLLLSGVKILDLSRVLAGPLATMILGDLGADVIKVERPGQGDDTRGWGPPFDDRGESAYYLSINRNKLSIAVDLGAPADRDLLHRLLAEADVVVENFRPGTLERHGMGSAAMLAAHPRLVWCTITGFGLASPRPGYDFVVQAESGWMAITGAPDGAPMKAGVAIADVLAGKDAAIAILAALAGGRRGDRHLSVSLLQSATTALVNVAQNTLVSGAEAGRWGNAHANLVPYELFDAADRALVIAVGNDAQFAACARALDLHALASDPGLATNAGRLARRDEVVSAIADRVRTAPASDWIARLDAVGVPCGVVKPVREALEAVAASPLTGVAPQAPGTVRHPPPRLDEHGTVVRRDGWRAFRDLPVNRSSSPCDSSGIGGRAG